MVAVTEKNGKKPASAKKTGRKRIKGPSVGPNLKIDGDTGETRRIGTVNTRNNRTYPEAVPDEYSVGFISLGGCTVYPPAI